MGLDNILTPEQAQRFRKELQDVRSIHTSYFEKLALLDGGTVALIVTVVIGQLHAQLKHKYTLAVGLTLLVLAMFCLMLRNYFAVRMEELITRRSFHAEGPDDQQRTTWLHHGFVNFWARAGSLLTAAGMFVLLAEVWMILW